jgi:DnaJ-domain-containing protein 1
LTVDTGNGGSYGQYLRTLLAPNLEVRAGDPDSASDGGQAKAQPELQQPHEDKEQAVGTTPEGEFTLRAAADDIAALDEALSTIKLDTDEVEFLASFEIGRLAAKEPRTVKRLANVYRIVRARMTDRGLRALKGDGGPPSYPILVVLSAIETGQPVEVANAFYDGLLKSEPGDVLIESSRRSGLQEQSGNEEHAAGGMLMAQAFAACPALLPALHAAQEKRGGLPITAGECVELARDVRRYSFNRYQ